METNIFLSIFNNDWLIFVCAIVTVSVVSVNNVTVRLRFSTDKADDIVSGNQLFLVVNFQTDFPSREQPSTQIKSTVRILIRKVIDCASQVSRPFGKKKLL